MAFVCQNACLKGKKGERFLLFLGALFEKHGAEQTGILTNKSHYKETRSFEYLDFPAKLQAELFDVTHTLLAPRWRRSVVEFWATLEKDFVGIQRSLEAEILVNNIYLHKLFIGVKKINGHSGVNFSFKKNLKDCLAKCNCIIRAHPMCMLNRSLKATAKVKNDLFSAKQNKFAKLNSTRGKGHQKKKRKVRSTM